MLTFAWIGLTFTLGTGQLAAAVHRAIIGFTMTNLKGRRRRCIVPSPA